MLKFRFDRRIIPDEDWYWPVEIPYTQAFSRCLISPCSSPFDFHCISSLHLDSVNDCN